MRPVDGGKLSILLLLSNIGPSKITSINNRFEKAEENICFLCCMLVNISCLHCNLTILTTKQMMWPSYMLMQRVTL